jgi:hypothetical protein
MTNHLFKGGDATLLSHRFMRNVGWAATCTAFRVICGVWREFCGGQ